MDNIKIDEFKSALEKKILSELSYYNFEVTGPCKDWITSVIDYYVALGNFENNDLETAINTILDEENECNEECEFEWPDVSDAAAIVGKALRSDSSHFMYITEELNMSMSPDDCFKAEWFWKGSIRPDIINFIEEYDQD